jgi:5-oxoprolinase (ATP-hydrolysing) subunit C
MMNGLAVVNPGLATTVQDEGRVGWRAWGVPVGGAFDRASAALANALVGNPSGCAVLEMTLFGGTYEATIPLALALAGAPMDARIRQGDGGERPLSAPLSFPLSPGERLVLGGATAGARAYLAVRGGWQTPLVLGSRSSEDRLKPGAVLPASPGTTPVRRPAEALATDPADLTIRVIDGPDAPEGSAPHPWVGPTFRVGRTSDRVGLRLEGPPIALPPHPARLSMPLAPGAIQLAGGQLIVLGVSCGTMGGYPHVAHVISADLDRLGQARPGDPIRFQAITLDEARRIDLAARSRLAVLLRRVATVSGGASFF